MSDVRRCNACGEPSRGDDPVRCYSRLDMSLHRSCYKNYARPSAVRMGFLPPRTALERRIVR